MNPDRPRHDRTGDIAEPEQHHCEPGGWLPGHTPDDEKPRPCPICRPWTRPDRRRARTHGPHGG